jgi:hypothetical protein
MQQELQTLKQALVEKDQNVKLCDSPALAHVEGAIVAVALP